MDDVAGRTWAAKLRERMVKRRLVGANLRWVLKALGSDNWHQVRRLSSEAVALVKLAYAKIVSQPAIRISDRQRWRSVDYDAELNAILRSAAERLVAWPSTGPVSLVMSSDSES